MVVAAHGPAARQRAQGDDDAGASHAVLGRVPILRSQLPLLYLWHPVNRHGVNRNVRGVQTYGDGLIRAYNAEFIR